MHKEEAAKLFASLGDANRVKIVKMLYHNKSLDLEALKEKIGISLLELKADLDILLTANLISKEEEDHYFCNKDLLDTLFSFIPTKCSCC